MNNIILSGMLPFSWAELNMSGLICLPELAFFQQLICLLEKTVKCQALYEKSKWKGGKIKRKGTIVKAAFSFL